jgi:hypothetical protein
LLVLGERWSNDWYWIALIAFAILVLLVEDFLAFRQVLATQPGAGFIGMLQQLIGGIGASLVLAELLNLFHHTNLFKCRTWQGSSTI